MNSNQGDSQSQKYACVDIHRQIQQLNSESQLTALASMKHHLRKLIILKGYGELSLVGLFLHKSMILKLEEDSKLQEATQNLGEVH